MRCRRMTCRATRASSEWLSALQSQPSLGSRYSILPEPVRIRNGAGSDILAQDCTMWRGDSLSSKSISDIWYDKAEQKSEVQQDYFQPSVSLSVEDVLWAGLVHSMPGSCFPKHWPREWGWCSSEAGPGTILFHITLKENASLHNSVSAIYFQLHTQLYLNGGLSSYSAFPDQKQGSVSGTVSLSSLFLWMKWCVPSAYLLQHHQCFSILILWKTDNLEVII